MQMPFRNYTASNSSYRYGFNGKENDNEVKGVGNQLYYGMRTFDPRIGKFLSVDPLESQFPFFSPYQYAGNSPVKFVDLDGAEPSYDNSAKFWSGQPLINMTDAKNVTGYNAAGIPRAGNWFFKQQLAAKPEMFSEANKLLINSGSNPIVDEVWVKYNPSHADYMKQKLWHHHIDGGETAAAIPRGLNNDYFSELHPYINAGKAMKGAKVSGLLGKTVNILGTVGIFSGMLTGDPDAWINAFGYGDPNVGDIKKDWTHGTGLYIQIMSIHTHYVPVIDADGKPVIDPQTGQPKYRIESKTITGNFYSDYIWNEETKKFEGVNKVGSQTEIWKYDEDGNRIAEEPVQML